MDALKKSFASLPSFHESGKSPMQSPNVKYFDQHLIRTSMGTSACMQAGVPDPSHSPASTLTNQQHTTTNSHASLSQHHNLSAHGISAVSRSNFTHGNSKNSLTSCVPAARAIPQLSSLRFPVLDSVSTSSEKSCHDSYLSDGASTAQAYVQNTNKLRFKAFTSGRSANTNQLLRHSSLAAGISQLSNSNTISSAQRMNSQGSSIHSTRHVAHARTCALSAGRLTNSFRYHPQTDTLSSKPANHAETLSKPVMSQVGVSCIPPRHLHVTCSVTYTLSSIHSNSPNEAFDTGSSQESKEMLSQSSFAGSEFTARNLSVASRRNRLQPTKALPSRLTTAACITASRADATLRCFQPRAIPCRSASESPTELVLAKSQSPRRNFHKIPRGLEHFRSHFRSHPAADLFPRHYDQLCKLPVEVDDLSCLRRRMREAPGLWRQPRPPEPDQRHDAANK